MTTLSKKQLVLMFTFIVFMLQYVQPVQGAEPEAVLIPDHGPKDSPIFLKIRGTTIDASLYLYWDDFVIVQGFSQNIPKGTEPGAGFDYNFDIPNQKPYSNLGIHTVTIEVTYNIFVEQPRLHKEGRIFNTMIDFEIEGEVIDFEQRYNDLLIDYEKLMNDYSDLQESHSELLTRLETLEREQNTGLNAIPGFPINALIGGISAFVLIFLIRTKTNTDVSKRINT